MLSLRSFNADEHDLLARFAEYAQQVDGVEASLQEHAESLILYALECHEQFQSWLADPQAFTAAQNELAALIRRKQLCVISSKDAKSKH